MIDLYDIKYKTETWADGVPTFTWAVRGTRTMEIQPKRWDITGWYEIELGGEKVVPTYEAWLESDVNITATDVITKDSGTTNLEVLRVYVYEDHKEADLRAVKR